MGKSRNLLERYTIKGVYLCPVKNGAKVEQSYTTSVFVDEDMYSFVSGLTPMTKLDIVFVPTNRGVQIIQLDIADNN